MGLFSGPVQTMEFVVPVTSTQSSISNEAAYMVWGFGAGSGVAPWTDPSFLLQRSATSGTENMIGAAINLPPSAYVWSGVKNASSTNIVTDITNVNKMHFIDGGSGSIASERGRVRWGILASDVADANRQVLKPLAFQDTGRIVRLVSGLDPELLRQAERPGRSLPNLGTFSIFIAYVDTNGNPINANVKTLIDALNGENTAVLATLDVVAFYASSHIVPTCAMHVARASDGQDYSSFAPPTSCSCYYDLKATGQVDPTECVSCTKSSDCVSAPGGKTQCVTSFGIPPVGYCEPPGTAQ